MATYLEEQIAVRRTRLLAMDQERIALLAEIRAYEDALAHAHEGNEEVALRPRGPVPRKFSKAWIRILCRLTKFTAFDAGDVERAARELGLEQNAVNIRSQLSAYSKAGVIRRRGLGKYRVDESFALELEQRERALAQKYPSPNSRFRAAGGLGPKLAALAPSNGG
jgi:hypothetical protein